MEWNQHNVVTSQSPYYKVEFFSNLNQGTIFRDFEKYITAVCWEALIELVVKCREETKGKKVELFSSGHEGQELCVLFYFLLKKKAMWTWACFFFFFLDYGWKHKLLL